MKQDSAQARKLAALIKRVRQAHKAEPPEPIEPVRQLVLGFFQWEATHKQAEAAVARIMTLMVDHNDLRVSHAQEVIQAAGVRYPRIEERAARLSEALNEIYLREHAVSLESLAGASKKDIRAYLESLPGIPQYVWALVLLLSFGGHAIPVDQKLLDRLIAEGCFDEGTSLHDAASVLERTIRAGEAVHAHLALQDWADHAPATRKAAKKTTKKTTRKTTKKTTKKTTAVRKKK